MIDSFPVFTSTKYKPAPSRIPTFLLGVVIGAILGAACTMAGVAFAMFTDGARG